MTRARTTFRTVGLLGAAALVAAGCGGGDAAVPTTETPAPSPDPNATTVVDPAAQVDPAIGLPVDPAAAGGAAAGAGATTASVPELSGDDLGGGLGSSKTNPIFVPSAISTEEAKDLFAPKADGVSKDGTNVSEDGTNLGSGSGGEKAEAPSFSGAKIYVDGIVHDVDKNGSFPKGNPVFRLLSVTGGDIEIELIAGEFTSGGGVGTVLDKGELVSLVNSSEQLTYRIKYLRPISGTDAISF